MARETYPFRFRKRLGENRWPEVKEAINNGFPRMTSTSTEVDFKVVNEIELPNEVAFVVEMDAGMRNTFTCLYHNFLHFQKLET